MKMKKRAKNSASAHKSPVTHVYPTRTIAPILLPLVRLLQMRETIETNRQFFVQMFFVCSF